MPKTHLLAAEAVRSVLSDSANGFNAQLAPLLPLYGIAEDLAINWQTGGEVFAELGSGGFRQADLEGALTLNLRPSGSVFTGETRGIKWSGRIGLQLIFHVRYSLRDVNNLTLPDEAAMTQMAAAIEDAVIEVFQQRPSIRWGDFGGAEAGLVYTDPPDCPDGFILENEGDGVVQTIAISVGFKVDCFYT